VAVVSSAQLDRLSATSSAAGDADPDDVAGAAGIGGSTVAAVGGASWWVVAPAAVLSATSGLLAVGGRTAELWRRIRQIGSGIEGDKALLKEIRRISAKLDDQHLPVDERLSVVERQQLIDQLVFLRGLLGE
jgi:hypothetical protein